MKHIFLSALAMLMLSSPAYATTRWETLTDKSSIEWTAQYGGKPVSGSFPGFTAQIAFDKDQLDASRVVVNIDVAKLKSDDKDAQDNLLTRDWFNAVEFPTATFETTSFTHVKDDQYMLEGTLKVRDKTAKLSMPFTAKFYDDKDVSPPVHYARMSG